MIWSPRERIPSRRSRRILLGVGETTPILEPRLLLSAEVLTYHNDSMRTGENLLETTLTPENVNPTDFGKVGQVSVDGAVYAQPLYKAAVLVPGQGTHNLLLVATENDSVYAFDADTLAPIWHDSFINPAAGVTPVSAKDVPLCRYHPGGGDHRDSGHRSFDQHALRGRDDQGGPGQVGLVRRAAARS